MEQYKWLGLTVEEAQALAARENINCVFICTKDPKQDTTGLVGKVIRARQNGEQLTLVVGYMIPGIE